MQRSVIILFLLIGVSAYGQFRTGLGGLREDDPRSVKTAMTDNGGGFLSGLFDPTRFSMHQTYSMSFSSSAGASVGLGVFTNTFSYRAADNLFISADLSAVYSPYSSLGEAHAKSLNGIYLSNARLDWKLGDHTNLLIIYNGGAPNSNMFGMDSYYPGLW